MELSDLVIGDLVIEKTLSHGKQSRNQPASKTQTAGEEQRRGRREAENGKAR
jgi:hypothetical protein